MRPRHPAFNRSFLPQFWLMTDERMGNGVIAAIRRLPKGKAGVVLRNYATPPAERRRLYDAVRAIARRNRLTLLLAGSPYAAHAWRADGWHGKGCHRHGHLIHGMAVHNKRELTTAIRAKVDLVFLSPVFATRSHAGARPLGPLRFGLLAQQATTPVIALGGMTSRRFRAVKQLGATGYAAIDAWLD